MSVTKKTLGRMNNSGMKTKIVRSASVTQQRHYYSTLDMKRQCSQLQEFWPRTIINIPIDNAT